MNLIVGKIVNVLCIDMNYHGLGVAKIDDFVIFTRDLFIDERASVRIISISKNYANAEVVNLITKSIHRVREDKFFLDSTDLYNLSDSEQLRFQIHNTSEQLKRAGLEFNNIVPISTENTLNYRNKCKFFVKRDKFLRLFLYDYKYNKIVITNFSLASKNTNIILEQINTSSLKFISILESITFRCNEKDELMINFNDYIHPKLYASNENEFLELRKFLYSFPFVKVVYPDRKPLKVEFKGVKYELSYNSFFQVNYQVADLAFDKISDFFNDINDCIDAYCGLGAIGFSIKNAPKVIFVDNNRDNIYQLNKKINSNPKYTSYLVDVNTITSKLLGEGIIVDPPRGGLDDTLINHLNSYIYKKISYLSCDLLTLVRDLKKIKDNYEIVEVYAVRMFPGTSSIETLVNLKKR
ncbi:MAG: hypothetical protein LBV58_00365 [Acholeplasmatales bacterium]|jgi:23S rRNA (uracil1939-C5)-methyltransferase|nr:hypothetical protein [Acholeplasmatales bacterium]